MHNYYAGVMPSRAVPQSSTVIVQQGGEVGDHSNDPGFYENPIPVDQLAVVAFDAYDVDDTYANPFAKADSEPLPIVQIVSMPDPSVCELYSLSGEGLDLGPTPHDDDDEAYIHTDSIHTYNVPFNATMDAYAVRIRPNPALYSVNHTDIICEVVYRAIDGTTNLPSVYNGTLSIVVTRIDRPPKATPQHQIVYAGRTTIIHLNGTDSDSALAGGILRSLPTYGSLYLVHTDGSVATEPLGAHDCPPSNCSVSLPSIPVAIAYKYAGPQDLLSLPGNWLNGSIQKPENFSFSMVDVEGRFSLPATVSISAETPYEATPRIPAQSDVDDGRDVCDEGKMCEIHLYGTSHADDDEQGNLMVQISALPLHGAVYGKIFSTGLYSDGYDDMSNHGAVNASGFADDAYEMDGYVRLQVGDIVNATIPAHDYSRGVSVYYVGDVGYFSYPVLHTYDDTDMSSSAVNGTVTPDALEFRVLPANVVESIISTDGAHRGLPRSPAAAQPLYVRNVNQATTIMFNYSASDWPDGNITVAPVGPDLLDDDLPTYAKLVGFNIIDPDADVDHVHVTIRTPNGGYITLDPEAKQQIDFDSIEYCNDLLLPHYKRWTCNGDGEDDASMSFVGRPAAVERALEGMVYESGRFDSLDTITITIYDGVGGLCLDAQSLSDTIYDGMCHNTSLVIPVRVAPVRSETLASELSEMTLKFKIIYLATGIVVITCICMCMYTCVSCCHRCFRCCCWCCIPAKSEKDHDDKSKHSRSRKEKGFGRGRGSDEGELELRMMDMDTEKALPTCVSAAGTLDKKLCNGSNDHDNYNKYNDHGDYNDYGGGDEFVEVQALAEIPDTYVVCVEPGNAVNPVCMDSEMLRRCDDMCPDARVDMHTHVHTHMGMYSNQYTDGGEGVQGVQGGQGRQLHSGSFEYECPNPLAAHRHTHTRTHTHAHTHAHTQAHTQAHTPEPLSGSGVTHTCTCPVCMSRCKAHTHVYSAYISDIHMNNSSGGHQGEEVINDGRVGVNDTCTYVRPVRPGKAMNVHSPHLSSSSSSSSLKPPPSSSSSSLKPPSSSSSSSSVAGAAAGALQSLSSSLPSSLPSLPSSLPSRSLAYNAQRTAASTLSSAHAAAKGFIDDDTSSKNNKTNNDKKAWLSDASNGRNNTNEVDQRGKGSGGLVKTGLNIVKKDPRVKMAVWGLGKAASLFDDTKEDETHTHSPNT